MKREVHAECHHEKGSEGSRKGEMYARRQAEFRHTPISQTLSYSFVAQRLRCICFAVEGRWGRSIIVID